MYAQHFHRHLAGGGFLLFAAVWLVAALLVAGLLATLITLRSRRPRQPETAVGSSWPSAAAGAAPAAALSLLDMRLARGDIDLDGYRAIRAELEHSSTTSLTTPTRQQPGSPQDPPPPTGPQVPGAV